MSVSNSFDDPVITGLLQSWIAGDQERREQLFERVYARLHRIARELMASERDGHTLGPTGLLHETYLRLAGADGLEFENRYCFLSLCREIMGRVLVDYARGRRAGKRGGERVRVELEEAEARAPQPPAIEVLAFEEVLGRFEALDERAARIVELKVFCGYSESEIEALLGVSRSTVQRDWDTAKRWLGRELEGLPGSSSR